jgi:DNA-binding transcriptional ArsR family regulator
MSMPQIISAEARLIILRELLEQSDGRLNSELLRATLETFGITKSRDWVHEELRWLADIGVVRVSDAGTVRIASLLAKGRDHVERRIVIEGIKRPSPPEA